MCDVLTTEMWFSPVERDVLRGAQLTVSLEDLTQRCRLLDTGITDPAASTRRRVIRRNDISRRRTVVGSTTVIVILHANLTHETQHITVDS